MTFLKSLQTRARAHAHAEVFCSFPDGAGDARRRARPHARDHHQQPADSSQRFLANRAETLSPGTLKHRVRPESPGSWRTFARVTFCGLVTAAA